MWICEECVEVIRTDDAVSSYHGESCSLHPNNVVATTNVKRRQRVTPRWRRLSDPYWSRTTFGGHTYTVKPFDNYWVVLRSRPDSKYFGDNLFMSTEQSHCREFVNHIFRSQCEQQGATDVTR